MKIAVLVALISFLSFQTCYSQNKKFGVIGGINYATITGDFTNFFEVDSRVSFHVGAFSNFSINDKISFSPRIVYSSQGYMSEFSVQNVQEGGGGRFRLSNRLNYLSLPVLVKFEVLDNFSINAGPQIAFLLNGASVLKESDNSDADIGSQSTFDGDFRLDYGGRIGLGYDLKSKVSLELAYFKGISNISRNDVSDVSNNNSVWQLSLLYTLF